MRGVSLSRDRVADLGQDQKRRPERGEVAAIGQSHGDPAAQALQVVNGLQKRPRRDSRRRCFSRISETADSLSRIRTGSRSG